MNWEAVGIVAEVVGSFAVVVTLIYLAIQVRQSKELSKTQSFHLAIEQLVAGAMRPEFSLLFESANRELTDDEKSQLKAPLIAYIYGHEILLYLWRSGQIDESLWQHAWLNNRKFFQMDPLLSLLEEREGPLSSDLLQLVKAEQS